MDIVLWNQSPKNLDDDTGQLIAAACDLQMRKHVAPAYGLQPSPRVTFCSSTTKLEDLPENRLVIIFYEPREQEAGVDTDPPTAAPAAVAGRKDLSAAAAARVAGFQITDPTTLDLDDRGRNFARVYPQTIRDNGGTPFTGARSISAATSHECIEATYDRNLTKWVWNEKDKVLVACEVCDQVEADAYPMIVQEREVAVSNFVYPAWFDARAHDCQFDQMGKLTEPFTCSKDGYLILYDPANPQDKVHTEPPGAALPAGWNAKNKSDGFARTRVRLVW